MVKKIRKAVLPAAGLGTRFLPATKAVPKEMLALAGKPLIQYSVEEAKDSGIAEMIFITNKDKGAIKAHFSGAPKIERILKSKKKRGILNSITRLPRLGKFSYINQTVARGLGHAVLLAEKAVKNEPFAVFLGDDIIDSKTPAMKQMVKVFNKYGTSVLAVQRVPKAEAHKYGIVEGRKVGPGLYKVSALVEKPKNPPSTLAVIGRYILTPEIFSSLKRVKLGSGGEVQLTDAISDLLNYQDVYALEFEGIRYDAGDKLGFLKAQVALGIKDTDTGKELKRFIRKLKV